VGGGEATQGRGREQGSGGGDEQAAGDGDDPATISTSKPVRVSICCATSRIRSSDTGFGPVTPATRTRTTPDPAFMGPTLSPRRLHAVSTPSRHDLGFCRPRRQEGNIWHLGDDLAGARGKRLTTSADPGGFSDADAAGQEISESKLFLETLDQSKNRRNGGAVLRLRTLSGEITELADDQLAELRMTFRGRLLAPQDDGYDQARVVQNGLIDRRPGLIVQCSGTADVIDAVNLASCARWRS
jgi:hypothetical protein